MKIPDLAGVITKKDLEKKGSKNFSADYIPWAKISNILLKKAPGWQFKIKLTPESGTIWRMPNNSGVIFCYFEKDDFKTPDFPYAITDYNHNPVPYDKITSKDYANNHRRALCACACFVFGLAYELWAKIEVQETDTSNPDKQNTKPTEQKKNLKEDSTDKSQETVVKIKPRHPKAETVYQNCATLIMAMIKDKSGEINQLKVENLTNLFKADSSNNGKYCLTRIKEYRSKRDLDFCFSVLNRIYKVFGNILDTQKKKKQFSLDVYEALEGYQTPLLALA